MPRSYAEIDRRILGDAYGSVETLENVTNLCDDYDSSARLTGSWEEII